MELVSKVVKETPFTFAKLYYWREFYDDAARKFIFRVSENHFDGFDDDRLANPYEAPQFPAARVPNFANGPFCCGYPPGRAQGPDAPVPAPEARRSGNILIVADQILLCDTCRTVIADKKLDASIADNGDVERRRFFITAGVKGGLAGTGMQNRCTLQNFCEGFDAPAYSGRHGDGGDAGDITILLYGTVPPIRPGEELDEASLWRRLSEATGGVPPFLGRLWTRSFSTYRQYNNRGENVFSRLPAEAPAPKTGEDGKITILDNIPAEIAISTLRSRLATLMLIRRYTPSQMIYDLRKSVGVDEEIVLPTDQLRRQMLEIRRDIYLTILKQAEIGIAKRPGERTVLPYKNFVSALACDSASLQLVEIDLLNEVRSLCALKPIFSAATPERTVLEISGGLFSPSPSDFDPARFDSLAVRTRLQRLQDIISQSAFDGQATSALLDENNVREDTRILEDRLKEIRNRIAELEVISRRSGNPLGDLVAGAIQNLGGRLGPRLGGLVAEIGSARDNTDRSEGRAAAEKAASESTSALKDVVESLLPISKFLLPRQDAPDTSSALNEARMQVAATLQEIATLQAHAATRREQRLKVTSAWLSNMLLERRALTDDYRSSINGFDALYKFSLISSSARSNDPLEYLKTRISDIRTYLEAYGKNSIPLDFSETLDTCGSSVKDKKIVLGKSYSVPDCVVLRNDSNATAYIRVDHPQIGNLVYAKLDGGTQKMLNFRGLNVSRKRKRALISVSGL